MKNILFICLAFITIFSCDTLDRIEGMGPIVETALEVDKFTGIALDAPFDVRLIQGDELQITAKGHQNIIDRLRTKVNNGKIEISLEKGNYKDFEMDLFITAPNIDYIGVDGAGKIRVGEFQLKELRCDIDGAADLEFKSTLTLENNFRIDVDGAAKAYFQEIIAEKVLVNIDGSGDLTLRGSATDLEVQIDGAGDVNAFALECETVEVSVDGMGRTEVKATQKLKVDIDGIGNVYYKGEPNIEKDIDGLGRLIDSN